MTGIDSFVNGVVKRTIHNFHITEKELPTLRNLQRKLQIDTFPRIYNKLKANYKTVRFYMENNRKLLIEQSQIRLQRIEYLHKMRKYREEWRPIIYTDESYVDSSHASQHSWSDNSTKGLKKQFQKAWL